MLSLVLETKEPVHGQEQTINLLPPHTWQPTSQVFDTIMHTSKTLIQMIVDYEYALYSIQIFFMHFNVKHGTNSFKDTEYSKLFFSKWKFNFRFRHSYKFFCHSVPWWWSLQKFKVDCKELPVWSVVTKSHTHYILTDLHCDFKVTYTLPFL